MNGPATCTNKDGSFVNTQKLLFLYNCFIQLRNLSLWCILVIFEIIDFLFPFQLLVVSPVACVATIAGSESFCCVLFSTVKTFFCDFEVAAHMSIIAGMCPDVSGCVYV